MMTIIRIDAPLFLKENQATWTESYISGATFSWHQKDEEIRTKLKEMSNYHCAFCDDLLFPKSGEIGEIEHFKPKTAYKELAFEWTNLYPICRRCNGTKNDKFDDLLLRPDSEDYKYSDWFCLDLSSFKLKPFKLANPNWKRAEKTIELYGLNKDDKIKRRQDEFAKIRNEDYKDIDNQPFRYI